MLNCTTTDVNTDLKLRDCLGGFFFFTPIDIYETLNTYCGNELMNQIFGQYITKTKVGGISVELIHDPVLNVMGHGP